MKQKSLHRYLTKALENGVEFQMISLRVCNPTEHDDHIFKYEPDFFLKRRAFRVGSLGKDTHNRYNVSLLTCLPAFLQLVVFTMIEQVVPPTVV
jgi:hypothetical protein